MSLYGALFSGVSGLKAQGSKIGIISDNISNVNTIGYKASKAMFETLVNNSSSTLAYNPGGVVANTRQLVDKQGLFSASDAPTDIAVSGAGMFVVRDRADSSSTGTYYYTRAGSFRQDAEGNFVNSSGFFLQGWPLDREGRLPGQAGNLNTELFPNLDSLETVNVERTSGVAAATTLVDVGLNLDSSQTVYPGPGSGRTTTFRGTNNSGIASDDIIVPEAGANGTVGDLAYGDTMTVSTSGGLSYTYTYGGIEESDALGAMTFPGPVTISSATQTFYTASTAPTGADATFTINTPTTGTVTFTYVQTAPNPFLQQFNNLQSLATAIDEVNGLTARIQGGILYIAPEDANEALTFADGGAEPFVASLGLANTTAAGAGVERFATLSDLSDKVNASDGVSAVVESPLSNTLVTIRTDDPLGTITYDDSYGAAGDYGLLTLFGLTDTFTPPASVTVPTRTFGPEYDPANPVGTGDNMASGLITPHFSRAFRIYDAFGSGHDFEMSFLKTGINTWQVEIFAKVEGDISTSLPDNQVAFGTVVFNGDGSLRNVSAGLTNPITVSWTNGAVPSEFTVNWGTAGQPFGTAGATEIGLTDGLSQFDSDYNVAFVNQNGAAVGTLIGVTIDEQGNVFANYNNGESQALYRLPLADFANPNGLRAVTGNVYLQTQESGIVNLREAANNGMGSIQSGALESSNVELSEELTDMIVAQRAYQSNAKVISTSDDLLEELNRL